MLKLTEFNRKDRLKEACKMDAIMLGFGRFFGKKRHNGVNTNNCNCVQEVKKEITKDLSEEECMRMRRRKRINCARRGCERVIVAGAKTANFLSPGEYGEVVGIRAGERIKRHLSNLGFVNGTRIMLVNDVDGSVIFKVKESRIALGKELACRIMVVHKN